MLARHSIKCAALAASVFLTGCGGEKPAPTMPSAPAAVAQTASVDTLVATLQPTSGAAVTGVVVLTRPGDELVLGAAIDNVDAGEHSIHVHQSGDCSAGDGSSAGDLFAPDATPTNDQMGRVAGDFGNFTADKFQQGKFSITKQSDNALEIFDGRAIIVHANAADMANSSSDAAGSRIACGVLKPLVR